MNMLSSVGGAQAAGSSKDLIMLKKSQDLMKQQSAQLLEALPEPAKAPSPAGVGATVNLLA